MIKINRFKYNKIVNINKYNNVWFISDTHFDDDRLNLYGRDLIFNNKNEVDDFIIKQWNKNVKKTDLVIHVGDVALSLEGLKKVKKLNGIKWLVKGNYDEKETAKFNISDKILLKYFDSVFKELTIKINDEEIFINHYPTNGKIDKFNIVGHIHGTWKVQRNMINVGCDAWHFTPISLDLIKFQINGIRKYYDENVFAGELSNNFNNQKARIIINKAPNYIAEKFDDINIFLAGPIQGAENWQNDIIEKIQNEFKNKKLNKNIIINSPRRDIITTENFDYEEQVNWESYHLNKSHTNGIILFWMPVAKESEKGRSYAQTTRFELGEFFNKLKDNFIIGCDKNFHGSKYIKFKFKQKFNYVVIENYKKVIDELISKITKLQN